jgi:hypothetical protein
MVKIDRLWDITGAYLKPDINILYKRPRVDYRISEYVYAYINKNILKKYKIMQNGNYCICLSLKFYEKGIYNFIEYNIYNTENTIYSQHLSISTENGIKYKNIQLFCFSTELTENIKPKEYANMVYDMVGAFLVNKYKKITKEIMDENKNGIDYEFIGKYEYPAVFDNQKYMNDESKKITWSSYDGKNVTEKIEINCKEEYIKHYGE